MPTRSPDRHPLHACSDHIDATDDLVTGDDRHLRVRKLAIDHMQIRPADAAGRDLDPNLPRLGAPIRQVVHSRGVLISFSTIACMTISLIFRAGAWTALSGVLKAPKRSRQKVGQILGDEAGSAHDGLGARRPALYDCLRGRVPAFFRPPRLTSLRQPSGDRFAHLADVEQRLPRQIEELGRRDAG